MCSINIASQEHRAGHLNKVGRYIIQFQADCSFSGCYGIYANGGDEPTYGGLTRTEDGQGGGSMIVDYYGRIINKADDSREQIVFERIPLGWLRSWRERPFIRSEIYQLALEDTMGKYPSDLYTGYGMPESGPAALKMANQHARW